MRWWWIPLIVGCADLPAVEDGVCGNSVLEAGEDCDGGDGCGEAGDDNACRFVCDPTRTDETASCPEGFGCGYDGRCRVPSGGFTTVESGTLASATALEVGDLNGDGCDEAILTSTRGTDIVGVASQDDDGCSGGTSRLPALRRASAAPVLASIDPDDTLELLVPGTGPLVDGSGIYAFLAATAEEGEEASLRMLPVLLPSMTLQGPLEAVARHVEWGPEEAAPARRAEAAVVFAGEPTMPGQMEMGPRMVQVHVLPDPRRAPGEAEGTLDIAFSALSVVVAAEIDAEFPCEELLIGASRATELRVFSPCDASGEPAWIEGAPIALGGALRMRNSSVGVVDLDGDGARDDVVVSGAQGFLGQAFGRGDGTFHSTADELVTADQSTSPWTPTDAQVVGDPASLSLEDNVFVTGSFANQQSIAVLPCPRSSGGFSSLLCTPFPAECSAAVVDLDGDGIDDVVSTAGELPDLTLRFSVEAYPEDPYVRSFPTTCPPRGLAGGDFDGDGLGDVAYLDQARDADEEVVETLRTVFGTPGRVPEPAVVESQIKAAVALAAGRFLPGEPRSFLVGLQAFGKGPEAMGSGVAVLFVEASSERLALAPLYFPGPPTPGELPPGAPLDVELEALVAGPFLADGAAIVAVTSKGGGPEILWVLKAGDDFASVRPSALPPAEGLPPCDDCLLVAVDVDGDGRTELLQLGDRTAVVRSLSEDGATTLESREASFSYRSETSEQGMTAVERFVGAPLVRDVDRDERDDVLVVDADGRVVVWWGDPSGSLIEEVLVGVEGCEVEDCLRAATWIQADGDPALELVVVTEKQVLELYDMEGRGAVFREAIALDLCQSNPMMGPTDPMAPMDPMDSMNAESCETSDFVALRAGDFDADGVDDLAIVTDRTFFVLARGVPVRE